jgi:hypothetical protein
VDRSGSGQVQVDSSCERGNEPLGSIKCWATVSECETGGLLSSAHPDKVIIIIIIITVIIVVVVVVVVGWSVIRPVNVYVSKLQFPFQLGLNS